MKRFLLIPVAVGLIAGYVVSAQTPKPANLTVKAADNTQLQSPPTQTQPTTSQPTADSPVPQAAKPADYSKAIAPTPTLQAPATNQASQPQAITVQSATPRTVVTGQHKDYYCDEVYTDGSVSSVKAGESNDTNWGQVSESIDCTQFIGQAK